MKAEPVVNLRRLFDREPPMSLEAEMCLLGSMILDPTVIGDAVEVVPSREAFFSESHGEVYEAIRRVYDRTSTVDIAQVMAELQGRGTLDAVGGGEFLLKLAEGVPSAVNAPHFARIVAERAQLRGIIDAAGQAIHECYNVGDREVGDVIDAIDQRIRGVLERSDSATASDLSELLNAVIEQADGTRKNTGLATGYAEIDDMTSGGLHEGEMVLIAARPSMGKSALAFNIAENMLVRGVPVVIFSMEMGSMSVAQRMMASLAKVDGQRIRSGKATDRELRELIKVQQAWSAFKLRVDDTANLTVNQLRARARRYVREIGAKVVFIDYLQLMTAAVSRGDGRQQEVAAISRGVKALARELGVPVVALSQLNRASESREGNRPRLGDLRESGSLEQDADVVMLIHREEHFHAGDEDWANQNPDKRGLAEVIIAKQRNGPTGLVRMTWRADLARFDPRAPESMNQYVGEQNSGWA